MNSNRDRTRFTPSPGHNGQLLVQIFAHRSWVLVVTNFFSTLLLVTYLANYFFPLHEQIRDHKLCDVLHKKMLQACVYTARYNINN